MTSGLYQDFHQENVLPVPHLKFRQILVMQQDNNLKPTCKLNPTSNPIQILTSYCKGCTMVFGSSMFTGTYFFHMEPNLCEMSYMSYNKWKHQLNTTFCVYYGYHLMLSLIFFKGMFWNIQVYQKTKTRTFLRGQIFVRRTVIVTIDINIKMVIFTVILLSLVPPLGSSLNLINPAVHHLNVKTCSPPHFDIRWSMRGSSAFTCMPPVGWQLSRTAWASRQVRALRKDLLGLITKVSQNDRWKL